MRWITRAAGARGLITAAWIIALSASSSVHGFQCQPRQHFRSHSDGCNAPLIQRKRKTYDSSLWALSQDDTKGTITDEKNPTTNSPESPPSFFQALWGIATTGSPWEYMLTMRAQGYDGVVPINLGPGGIYNFLMSPSAVRSATLEEASSLPRRFSVPLFETLELDKGLVYEQGSRHSRHKKLCIPSFEQTPSMETYVDATRSELDDLTHRFHQNIQNAEADASTATIDLYADMRRSTLNVVLAVTFGLGLGGETKDDQESFGRADELSQTIGEYLERIVALANEIPPLWQISPRLSSNYVRVTDVLLPTLRELVAEVIAARRLDDTTDTVVEEHETSTKINKADLLSVLVDQPDLNDNDIRSILFDVVIAGSDTTASTTTAALYVLHEPQNVAWLQRAREEAFAKEGGDNIPLKNLRSELPVATSIAREILRLYPPVPFVGRTATQTGTLCQGQYPIEIGDTFCFSPWYLGRDPRCWGSCNDAQDYQEQALLASTFNPQRWLDDPLNGGAPTMFSWLPFGAGPRGCLGTRLGLTEVTLGISRLLRDFTFDFEQRGPLPGNCLTSATLNKTTLQVYKMKLTKKIAVATGSSADIEIDMIDASFRDTYASILLYVVDLRGANGEFQAEEIAEQHQDRVPTTTSPLEKAIVSQTIRVIWYTLVLDEEKIVFEEHDTAPRPNIPYGDSNNGSMSSSSGGGGGCGGKGFGK